MLKVVGGETFVKGNVFGGKKTFANGEFFRGEGRGRGELR